MPDPLRLQAAYYIATGVWPLLHVRSFMALTGPKRDVWLVQTFGALVAALGATLLPHSGGNRQQQQRTAVACALTLAACELVFVGRGRISPIYLADAALELLFAASAVKAGRRFPER
jgi:hypothetical protein